MVSLAECKALGFQMQIVPPSLLERFSFETNGKLAASRSSCRDEMMRENCNNWNA